MKHENCILESARKYTRWGWRVVPVPPKQKGPRLKEWQKLRLEESDLPEYFESRDNIGILLGKPSRGLVDVDLDCGEAIVLAAAFLPPTGRIHGRKSKPESHRWYRVKPIPRPLKLCDPDGTCLVEIRSTGQQTIAPPSLHPSGERLKWKTKGRAGRVKAGLLENSVRRLAAAVLLARHWPSKGSRNEAALALAGMLLRAGWEASEAAEFISAVAEAASDEESRARKAVAVATRKKLDKSGGVTGRPRLAKLLGAEVVDRTCEWLGIGQTAHFPERIAATKSAWPEPLAEEAFHGPAGDCVRAIEPETEADPAALLVQILAVFGNVVGPSPHFEMEAAKHGTNLFSIVVGRTAKARKGTSWAHVLRIFERVNPVWFEKCVVSGLSSGEGVIWAVRDAIEKHRRIKKGRREVEEEIVIEDEGVEDKRLMVYESEFAGPLRVQRREGNILSPILRQAWESSKLRVLTKTSPVQATGGHVSIVSHITQDELRRELTATDEANGYANRFLFVCAKRSKHLPFGGRTSTETLDALAGKFKAAAKFARAVDAMRFSKQATALWCKEYPRLTADVPGLLGAIVSRAEAQVLRLAIIYALLDRSRFIDTRHLRAALAVWRYCEDSARYIFGDALGDRVADELLRALRKSPKGLTRTEIRELFSRNRSESEISKALDALLGYGLARSVREETGGRPSERWFAMP